MVFAVPAPRSETDPEARFEFTLPGSKEEWSLPLLRFMPRDHARDLVAAMGKQNPSEFYALLMGEPGTPLADATASLTTDQLNALVGAWAEESGISPGESEASSNS